MCGGASGPTAHTHSTVCSTHAQWSFAFPSLLLDGRENFLGKQFCRQSCLRGEEGKGVSFKGDGKATCHSLLLLLSQYCPFLLSVLCTVPSKFIYAVLVELLGTLHSSPQWSCLPALNWAMGIVRFPTTPKYLDSSSARSGLPYWDAN